MDPDAKVTFEHDGEAHVLRASQWLPVAVEELFPFYADAWNLERITPPSLRFEVLTTGPIEMGEGVRIDYRLRLRGVPMRWRSVIRVWDPPRCFVDEQERGPYRLWWHEHTFAAEGEGTRVNDRVRYRIPGGGLIERPLVRPELRRIFTYRQRALASIFGQDTRAADAA